MTEDRTAAGADRGQAEDSAGDGAAGDGAAGEHPIMERIVAALREQGMWHETFAHKAVRTSEEAAGVRSGYGLHQGAKALIVRARVANEGKRFLMLVFPADRRFDRDKVKALLNAKDIRFASEEEVVEVTGGVRPGGVPPFGNLFGLEVISDPALYENERIVFNAGRTTSIAMRSADYRQLVEPRIAEITENPPAA